MAQFEKLSFCSEVTSKPPYRMEAINILATNIFSVKGVLRPIFCIDINTHNDRKWKIM